jgi:hypothetical protein
MLAYDKLQAKNKRLRKENDGAIRTTNIQFSLFNSQFSVAGGAGFAISRLNIYEINL